jgi:hypothetical protein
VERSIGSHRESKVLPPADRLGAARRIWVVVVCLKTLYRE